jgi:hypothetical protein
MANKVTYVVDHGEDSPALHFKQEINGGTLIAFAFKDCFDEAQTADALLEKAENILLENSELSSALTKEVFQLIQKAKTYI